MVPNALRFCFSLGLLAAALIAGCNNGEQIKNEPPIPTAHTPSSSSGRGEWFKVKFATSAGDFVVRVNRDWSPRGADRIEELVEGGFYDGCRFFRVVQGFMVQFGINGDPVVQAQWRDRNIQDDPVIESNRKGYVTFAKTGAPHSRSTQIFVNYSNNAFLDSQGFSPFGEVVEGMDVVESIYSGYGETPDQGLLQHQGNEYLAQNFPKLDYVKTARIIERSGAAGE